MDKSKIILGLLARKEEPSSINDLLEATENTIPQRSLRRILKNLENEGKVIFIGGFRNRKYQIKKITVPLSDLFVFSYTNTCKEYQVTCESIGFDVQRAQYRTPRRALIASIIKEKILHKNVKAHVEKETKKSISKVDQQKFIDDVLNDISLLDNIKIAGLGVTQQEFETWMALDKMSKK